MGSGANVATETAVLGTDQMQGTPANLPPQPQPREPGELWVALKYVTYVDGSGQPVVSPEGMAKIVDNINELYAPCDLRFIAEEYLSISPKDLGLDFELASLGELDTIRTEFDDVKHLVVINTGPWNHYQVGAANAWTVMPGNSPSGAVIDALVADSAEVVAHELGHYLNLDHVSDPTNLMNPIIYASSTRLSPGQCDEVRQAATSIRAEATR